jgi:fibronectin type 3 domain-containing protein
MFCIKIRSRLAEFRLLQVLVLSVGLAVSGSAVWAQAYNWKPVQIHGSGFVTGIQFHPNESGLMYCRTDIGGAYRWNPTNNTWIPLQDFIGYPNNEWNLVSAESIGLDAQNSNRLYLSCGWLGSPNEIMISTNRGATFTRINSPFAIRANDDGRGTGERFGVDPNLGSTIFYGTRQDGLWKSVNYAANWAKVASFPVNTTANGVGLTFVEFIQTSGTPGSATPVIWVGVAQGGTNLFRSIDGGVTWTGVATNGVPGNHFPLRAAQDGLGNMYLTFCDGPGPNGISAGAVRKFNLNTLTSINVTPPTGQGGFGGVCVDRQNPNIVVVTTANRWWPLSDIYRSTNGGTNWTAIYSGQVDTSSAPYMNSGGGSVIQGWMFDIKIDPYNSNRVYYVTGGGVFSSYNFGNTTPSWEFRSDGIEESAFTSVGMNLAVPPSGGPQLLSVFGDIGGFAHYNLDVSPPLTNLFYPNAGGNNYGINFAELSPNLVVRTYYNNTRGGYISTNSGSTWTQFPTQPVEVATSGPGTVVLSADGNRMIWSIAGVAPYYSTDRGVTWSPCAGNNLAPTESWEEPYPFADRVNPNKFYLYYRVTGRVFVSTDGGASFALSTTISAWGDSMHTTFGHEGHVWVAIYDGLWRSTNSGASFFKVPGVQAAHTVGFGRTATGTGYPVVYLHGQIGGTWGVYRSENQGTNWTRINDNQHQYGNIQQVIGDPKIYGRCYIAAGGRGIFYGDIPNQPPFTPTGVIATASNAAVQLNWYNAARADSYTVKRSTTSGSGYTTIASGVTATSCLDTGLVNDTTYYYVIAATNNYSGSADSTEVNATPAAPTNLRALYAFESNAQDSSGSGNHGTATAVSYVVGKVSLQAAQFNGTSSYVSIPRSVQDDFTVAMWVKTTDTAGGAGAQWWSGKGLVDGEVGGGGADWGTAIVNGKFVLGIGSSGGDSTFASSVNINDGNWHHVAATRNNTSGAVAVYVDAILRGTGTGATGSRTFMPSLRIGSLQTGNNFFSGTLDDVRLYDRILSVGEIAALVAPPAAPTNLIATIGDASVALSWSASSSATSYYLKRSLTSGSGYTAIATNTSLAFTNTGLSNGTLYYFVVSAVGPAGEGANSAAVSARPTSSAPVTVSATSVAGQLQLSWPADHTGWRLQSQTNSLATGLGANWATISNSAGTNQITMPVNPANGAVFFRLVRP